MASKKPPQIVQSGRSIRRQLESIKKKKLSGTKVVSLSDFRDLKRTSDRHTILVVDDEEIMRNAIKRVLENEGLQVVVAEDGFALSKVLETIQLDLILLDVNLPWVDGYELCQLLKNHPILKNVPVIFVSARKTAEDIQKGIAAGASDYITKPFDVDYLVQMINKAILKVS